MPLPEREQGSDCLERCQGERVWRLFCVQPAEVERRQLSTHMIRLADGSSNDVTLLLVEEGRWQR